MASIIKVDTIQTAAGGTPTAADLGINTTGTVLQYKQVLSGASNTNISNTSYVVPINSAFYVDITPTAIGSKLYMWGNMDTNCETSGVYHNIGFVVSTDGGSSWGEITASSTGYVYWTGMTRLESNFTPVSGTHTVATTNTHRISYKGLSGNGTTGFYANGRATINVIEIAG